MSILAWGPQGPMELLRAFPSCCSCHRTHPFLLFHCLSSLHCRAIGLGMSWAPAVTPLAEVIGAVSVEMPLPLALQAVTARGGGGRVGGRGAVFWVWLISGAFAPCPITVIVCIKLFKIVNNASSCEASVDEVRDKEFFGVPDDI